MLAIGLMSGTSVDGLDIALVEIKGFKKKTKLKLLNFLTVKYPKQLKAKIFKCFNSAVSCRFICSLNFEIGLFYGKSVNWFLKQLKIENSKINFIASHGQTIYHLVNPHQNEVKSSLQLGDISVICNVTKIKTIGDFRIADIAVAGCGAPLVAYADYLLFSKKGVVRLLQNIGGISNVSVIYQNEQQTIAFDNGPGNVLIDFTMQSLFKQSYDKNGKQAFKGNVIKTMIDYLSNDPYYAKKPPKTTGREKYSKTFFEKILKRFSHLSKNDFLTSVTYFSAFCIANSYQDFIFNKKAVYEVYLSGGGSKNLYLLKSLQQLLPNIKVNTVEKLGWNIDAKEAIEFAVLGYQTYHHNYSNLPSVTNAKRKVILGKIANFYKEK